MVHQHVSEDLWFRSMLGIDVNAPPLPGQETRLEFIRRYAEDSQQTTEGVAVKTGCLVGRVLLFGFSQGEGFKTTTGVIAENYSGGLSDGAIVKFAGSMPPAVLLHGGSFLPRFAPNTWVSVFLTDQVDATTRIWGGSDFVDNRLPEDLDGFSVSFNGRPGYVSFISPTPFNVLSPVMGVAGPVEVRVASSGGPNRHLHDDRGRVRAGFLHVQSTRPEVRGSCPPRWILRGTRRSVWRCGSDPARGSWGYNSGFRNRVRANGGRHR